MFKTLAITAVMTLVATGASAQGYKLDAAGKCRDAKGAFAAADKCKAGATPAGFKLDSAGKCRDPKGAFAPAAKCPAPAVKK